MKLYCPVCDDVTKLDSGLLRCSKSSEKAALPFSKLYEKGDIPKNFAVELEKRWKEGDLSFITFKEFMGSYHLAKQYGLANKWEELVWTISGKCQELTGTGFVRTPTFSADAMAKELGLPKGSLHLKNESVQLMGSHKSRHLAGAILYLETLRLIKEEEEKTNLSIFSCGNAALGASAIAAAAGYNLYTFVPEHIEKDIEAILSNLGSKVVKVSREGSVGKGDPCNIRYNESLEKFDWVPFSCYGHDIWPSVEGCELLGYEFFVEQKLKNTPLDVIFVQIGGGGLANSVIQSARMAKEVGIISRMPRVYTVQTSSCYPLATSYMKIVKNLIEDEFIGSLMSEDLANAINEDRDPKEIVDNFAADLQEFANKVSSLYKSQTDKIITDKLREIAANRAEFFQAWTNNVPNSVAEGILDDTTYDGLEVVCGMLETGGIPFVADEETLSAAHKLGTETTNFNISATGTAGLAGLKLALDSKAVKVGEKIGLLFTGVETRVCKKPIKKENVITMSGKDKIEKLVG
jgi:threonine dehydratase